MVEEAGRLAGLFPDAREHIEVKHEEALDSWTQLLEKAEQRRDKLQQAEQLQTYFDQYRELMLVFRKYKFNSQPQFLITLYVVYILLIYLLKSVD